MFSIPLPYKLLAVAIAVPVVFLCGVGYGMARQKDAHAAAELEKQQAAAELARIESKAESQKAAEVLAYTQSLREQIARLRSTPNALPAPVACLDPDRVRDLNAAISAANRAAAGPGGPVPAAADTAGR